LPVDEERRDRQERASFQRFDRFISSRSAATIGYRRSTSAANGFEPRCPLHSDRSLVVWSYRVRDLATEAARHFVVQAMRTATQNVRRRQSAVRLPVFIDGA